MANYQSLQHVFLIAMPQLQDPFFVRSVVYIWEYNAQGAKGIIVNKPMKPQLGDLLRHLEISIHNERVEKHPMLLGGPMDSEQGLVIKLKQKKQKTDMDSEPALVIKDKQKADMETGKIELCISICSSKDELTTLASGEELETTLIALGHSEWEAGQLEQELKKNNWLVAPFNETTLFSILHKNDPETRSLYVWRDAVASLGINLNYLSLEVGHA